MRGKAPFCRMSLHPGRITPAYAGKRWTASKKETSRWDHPRICGEKLKRLCQSDGAVGSPPHMRGKERQDGGKNEIHGITPAYAGKRARKRNTYPCNRDRPRICGEKNRLHGDAVCLWGSPPHMRGKGCMPVYSIPGLRITPAYAGKSRTFLVFFGVSWDHPRICGEKTKKIP